MTTNQLANDEMNKYLHYDPVKECKYFVADKHEEGYINLSILVPMYNETIVELLRTLKSLHVCILRLIKSNIFVKVNILVILDGWKFTHASVQEYLKQQFPTKREEIGLIGKNEKEEPIATYVLQKTKNGLLSYVHLADYMAMKVTFLIKQDNRRKHNSHDWFLTQYAREMEADYVFLTDCGTLFDEKCLTNLFREITKDDTLVGVSGRQRVMTADQQGDSDSFRGILLRNTQCFDYEACLSSFNMPFSYAGMLPVMPGPCGLYNFHTLSNHAQTKKFPQIPSKTQLNSAENSKEMDRSMTKSVSNVNIVQMPMTANKVEVKKAPMRSFHYNKTPQGQIVVVKQEIAVPAQVPVLIQEHKDDVKEKKEEKKEEFVTIDISQKEEPTDKKKKEESAIEYYTEAVKKNPEEVGMVEASLMLAEDRILSYGSVIKAQKRARTAYVPDAVFYFEAETRPVQLLQQRRRWINGTVAGYIWLLSNIGLLWNSKLYKIEKLFLTMLVFAQMMMFVVMAIGVSIMTVGIRFILVTTFKLGEPYVFVLTGMYFAMYCGFVWLHCFPTTDKNKPKLHVMYFDMVTLVNAIFAALLFVTLFIELFKFKISLNTIIVFLNMGLPFILAGMHSLTSLRLMLKSFIPFMLMLPTFTIYFSTYAFSRLWELTWGNRPSDKLMTVKQEKTNEEMEKIKEELHASSRRVIMCIVVINLICVLAFSQIQFDYTFIIVMEVFIFGWSMFQMLMSFICFIGHNSVNFAKLVYRYFRNGTSSRKANDLKERCKGKQEGHCMVILNQIEFELRAGPALRVE